MVANNQRESPNVSPITQKTFRRFTHDFPLVSQKEKYTQDVTNDDVTIKNVQQISRCN